jgi:hypothetical protein
MGLPPFNTCKVNEQKLEDIKKQDISDAKKQLSSCDEESKEKSSKDTILGEQNGSISDANQPLPNSETSYKCK